MTLALRWRAPARPVELRWRGPDLKPAALLSSGAPASLTAVVGPPGRDGGATIISAVAATSLTAGMPVFIDRATGLMTLAVASWKPSAFVIGLVNASAASGFVANAAVNQLTLPDWSTITGAASLLVGQVYFLGANGGLTTTPPGSPNVITLVGKAASATSLLIAPQAPIAL